MLKLVLVKSILAVFLFFLTASTITVKKFYGTASYYHTKFHNRKTASGEKYDQNKFTAACNALPIGTWVEVTNLKNGKCVIVRINDRIGTRHRLIDLSRIAAEELGYIKQGLARVKVTIRKQ